MAEPGKGTHWVVILLICLGLASAAGWAGYHFGIQQAEVAAPLKDDADTGVIEKPAVLGAEVISGPSPKLRLSAEAYEALKVKLANVERAPDTDTLSLTGSLLLDSNRLAYVHSRFSGEVVSIGTITSEPHEFSPQNEPTRPIRVGDYVKKGQLLAVVWSKEVGEKKKRSGRRNFSGQHIQDDS